jgi:hypothetical protein
MMARIRSFFLLAFAITVNPDRAFSARAGGLAAGRQKGAVCPGGPLIPGATDAASPPGFFDTRRLPAIASEPPGFTRQSFGKLSDG